jgi:condensin complex subunit 1
VEAVAQSSEAIMDAEVFDIYRSLLKYAHIVPGLVMSKLLDSISSGLHVHVEATLHDIEQDDQETFAVHKTSLEMYAFLLQWFVSAVERVKGLSEDAPDHPAPRARRGRGGKAPQSSRTASSKKTESWTWVNQIPATLALISKVLRLKLRRIWSTVVERDTFVTYVFFFPSRML